MIDLTKPSDLKRLLSEHGLQLSKRFGQNFLVDRVHLMRVVETAAISLDDTVLEIGPGVGTLTVELATRARRVLTVELDRGIIPVLTQTVAPYPQVEVLQSDALKLDFETILPTHLGAGPYKVAANIPYNITSPLLVKLLEARGTFASITLMVQKEVADRLRAAPDTNAYGSLSVFAQYYANVSVAGIVPRGAFFPPPKVDSAIVHLVPRPCAPVDAPSDAAFFAVSRSVFGQRRKTIHNALSHAPVVGLSREQVAAGLEKAGIEGGRRGETLDLAEIAAIARALFDRG